MMDVLRSREFFIGGRWATPSTGDTAEIISPHSGEAVARIARAADADIDAAVRAARTALPEWSALAVDERMSIVERLADVYAPRMGDLADLITLEAGTTTTFANSAQVPAAWMQFSAFLAAARDFPWVTERAGAFGLPVEVRHDPIGVVAAIVPWNVPQFTALSKVIPALIAGNTVVLKPAEETPLDGLLLAELMIEAGVPEGVVNIVSGGRGVGSHLVGHPDVDKVAFTGSTAAGREIAAVCGRQLKRVSLELGGKSAAIILDDAELDSVVPSLQGLALMNSGQACVAQTRILASQRRYSEVVDALVAMVEGMRLGDPADPTTQIGPMVSRRQQERVNGYIEAGIAEGAKPVTGGPGTPPGFERGAYVRPTVFTEVDNGMRIAQEEIFGPVLSVIAYDDLDDAVRIANDSAYGLAGTVWTDDRAAGQALARRIEAGTFGVNTYTMDIAAPFGGVKSSGLGREFGPEGLSGYTELKSIYG